jgi:hypothetical protein
MNTDDFEKRLQQVAPREVPSVWREDILRLAKPAAVSDVTAALPSSNLRPSPWWRELFWPCPQAWAALGAVWLLILGQNIFFGSPAPQVVAQQTAPPSPELRKLLKQQSQLFAELVGPRDKPQAGRPKPHAPQPRSSRREECWNA